ncbi:MAG: DUF47 family protein [Acidiphilium sp.]|nr:DUF47 family protein [Acidiphilium sp.]MDD4934468.1 DUF47 family protein [Acidiphilium sp.]
MKAQILAAIGETELQPASSLNAALAANDRLKYFFSLLQMALAYAEHPEQEAATLKRERIACGIDDPDLDAAIASARITGKSCHVSGAATMMGRIADDLRLMAAPLRGPQGEDFAGRLAHLLATLPDAANDLLDPEAVSAMMRAGHDGPDSIHRLVMDLHKQLNTMQAALATETLDGAATYNLDVIDRPLVAAFMAGLNRTAKLKFNHPGLATTATRAGEKLLIQNDIGTTDAHVIVIHVQNLSVSVTYTDVHAERLEFFQEMLKPHEVVWEGNRTAVMAAGAPFYMATGRFEATTQAACQAYLEFLGSRLVFLIDWNRARKQLRGFLRGPDRLALLRWAAETETGHRGFLELGGAHLVNQAIEAAAGSSMHFGDRLCDVLGDAETIDFLRFVFSTTTSGLFADQSHALINDRIRAQLATHVQNQGQQLLRLAADHAGLIFELASTVRDGLQADSGDAGKHARRARRFEHDADHMVMETRETVRRRPDYAVFLPLIVAADESADALEDAAFFLNLDTLRGKPLEDLQVLAGLLVDSSQEWIKALGHAHEIGTASGNAEMEDFLAALDRIAAIEHEADDAERKLTEVAFQHAEDFRQLHLFNALGGKLEAAADALKHASLLLRDHMLEDVING